MLIIYNYNNYIFYHRSIKHKIMVIFHGIHIMGFFMEIQHKDDGNFVCDLLGPAVLKLGWTAMAYVYPHKLGQPYDFGEIDPLSETALKKGGNCSELGNK